MIKVRNEVPVHERDGFPKKPGEPDLAPLVVTNHHTDSKMVTLLCGGIVLTVEGRDLIMAAQNAMRCQSPFERPRPPEKQFAMRGLKICFSGSMKLHSREEYEERIKKLGGTITATVTKDLNCLVYGKHSGSKHRKAEELNVICWPEKAMLEYLDALEDLV